VCGHRVNDQDVHTALVLIDIIRILNNHKLRLELQALDVFIMIQLVC